MKPSDANPRCEYNISYDYVVLFINGIVKGIYTDTKHINQAKDNYIINKNSPYSIPEEELL